MKPVVLHPLAEEELADAVVYYENQGPGLGLDLRAETERKVEITQHDPERWPRYKQT